MTYRSLYLKYRPQKFEEVAGQKTIVQTLLNSLTANKIGHAYLFAGPRGTGKTTMARLFAKALNCEEGLGHQCCKCSNCLAIADGIHPDVIEIDAASNNGVDQVRELIDKVKYSPIKGKYKVYIIDEVHMMTPGAFNALLKTLEEPPADVIFILCTTEPHKVIPTILSRCQRFDFGKISEIDMKNKLIEVLNSENATYDENGLNEIASLADGGMRDALSLVDQVLAYSGNHLYEKDVLDLYGLASLEEKISLLKSAISNDILSLSSRISSYSINGVDIRRLTSDIIAILKDFIVYSKTKDEALLTKLNVNGAKELATFLNDKQALGIVFEFVKTQSDYKNVNDVRSLFELTLLKIAGMNEQNKVDESPKTKIENKKIEIKEEAKETKTLETKIDTSISIKEDDISKDDEFGLTLEEPPSFLFEEEKKEEEKTEKVSYPNISKEKITKLPIATDGEMYSLEDDEIIKIMTLGDKIGRKDLLSKWGVFDSLRNDPDLGAFATLLSSSHLLCLTKEVLILVLDFTKLRDKVNYKANQKTLSDLVKEILGRTVFVYALNQSEKNRILNKFFSLQQLNRLPEKSTIQLKLPK